MHTITLRNLLIKRDSEGELLYSKNSKDWIVIEDIQRCDKVDEDENEKEIIHGKVNLKLCFSEFDMDKPYVAKYGPKKGKIVFLGKTILIDNITQLEYDSYLTLFDDNFEN